MEKEEHLDIVNDLDQVIGSELRKNIHRNGLLHREIHVWLYTKDNEIIFQKRGIHKDSAGLLDATIGGHVDKGENYQEAATREIQEETGITAIPEDLVFLKKFNKSYKRDDFINNFIRTIYILKYPIELNKITKEAGNDGVDFKKIHPSHLSKENINSVEEFDEFILSDEIPEVLNFLNKMQKR